ncbi:hypothetical protein P3T35_000913 [Kitasatospora sp. GP30]|nr:hypothetical protein [Kitasatospora sp. GP30]MDH6138924.1 hypothetical protein [Kitasatospora sp. GP30]
MKRKLNAAIAVLRSYGNPSCPICFGSGVKIMPNGKQMICTGS